MKKLPVIIILFLFSAFIFSAHGKDRDFVHFEIAKRHFRTGIQFYNSMKYLAAVEYFRKAIKEYPDYASARDYLARSYRMAGFIDEALIELKNYQKISPNNLAIQHRMAALRFRDKGPVKGVDLSSLVIHTTYQSDSYNRFSFSNPVDCTIDNEKNIYISSFSSGKIVKIDPNGRGIYTKIMSLDSKLYGIRYFNGRLAVANFSDDKIYILNKKGSKIKTFGTKGSGKGQFHGPEGLDFDKKGNIYVVDSGNHRIQKFTPEGDYILHFGAQGDMKGDLSQPTGVAVFNNRVYVTDTGNKRIAVFDLHGNFIKNILEGIWGTVRGITIKNNKMVISDEKKGLYIYAIDANKGRWFKTWNNGTNSFSRAISSTIDRDGYLYALDYNRESLMVFEPLVKRFTNLDLEITSVDIKKFPVVAFYVTVKSRSGEPVYGLKSENFSIVENKARIKSVYTQYLKKMVPSVSLNFCVDRSKKMAQYHNDIPWALNFIMKKMKRNDRLRIINFHNNIWESLPYDWSRRRALRALKKRNYRKGKKTGAALYDGITSLLDRMNRRALIYITDGTLHDNSFSRYTVRNVISYAQAHFIPIYIISFKKPDIRLKRIARETGGALFRPAQIAQLSKLYQRVKKSEEYRYVLVYSTYKNKSFKNWWSDVKVEVTYKGQRGKEWGGYFVP